MDIQRLKSAKIYFLLAAIFLALPGVLGSYKGQTGKILIATEQLDSDPHFAQTVIYIFDHSVLGAQGIILNRPRQSLNLKERLFKDHDVAFYQGGPVSFPALRLVAINRLKAVSPWRTQSLSVLRYKKFRKLFPEQADQGFDIYLGYSGWGAGQLEKEIRNGAWIVNEYSSETLDNVIRQSLWADLSRNN
ncbi:MAG: hypothetical protein COA45_09930 [Zetaproteobacteria bacterium]|nr:MAG: hypothetical protein COA45_09930 [Zetaproteobacteria bacterium]